MKPDYDPFLRLWVVKGIGYYKTISEAEKAIEDNSLSETLIIRISPKTKRRLEELSKKRRLSYSKLIRQLIEKEVRDNGN